MRKDFSFFFHFIFCKAYFILNKIILMAKRIVLKRSRKSFIGNYILGIVAFLTLFFVLDVFDLSSLIVYVCMIPIVFLFLEPEYEVIYSTYTIGEDSISEVKGVITKKRESIPWRLTAHTSMRKSIMGRIFNFGNIVVVSASGVENKIVLKGIKKPEKILEKIEDRMRKHKSL